MAEHDAFVGDYTNCKDLRDQQSRLGKLQYGSSNIAETGHPQSSGVIDRNTLCNFRPGDAACKGSARPSQRAVLEQTVRQQLNGSFRSVERQSIRKVEHNNKLQQARCAKLISNA